MLIVFNLVVTPILMEHQVKETDYGTFMSMIEKKNIGEVELRTIRSSLQIKIKKIFIKQVCERSEPDGQAI